MALLRLRTKYSPEMGAADIALTEAITAYEFRTREGSLEDLGDRLKAFHAAALSLE
jgi:hypothetical protein